MDFYDNVKKLVKTNNLNLRNFIESLGINYSSYNSCKQYGNLPRADDAVKIAQALGSSVEFLVTGEESRPDIRELQELRTKYEALVLTIKGIASTL